MKKLALASVAFAGVLAYGAGDAFAAPGFVAYTNAGSNPSGSTFSYTDTTTWSPLGIVAAASAAGGTAVFDFHSHNKHIGGSAAFGTTTSQTPPGFTPMLYVGKQYAGSYTSNTLMSGFPPGTQVLYNNASFSGSAPGAIVLSFTKGLSSIGLNLSPLIGDWTGTLTVLTGSSGNYSALGSTTIHNVPYCYGTSSSCPAQFVGASDHQAPITQIILSSGDMGPIGIGPLEESLFSGGAIPEPASLSVVGAGLIGLAALRRRRSKPSDGSRWSPFGRWRVAEPPADHPQSLS